MIAFAHFLIGSWSKTPGCIGGHSRFRLPSRNLQGKFKFYRTFVAQADDVPSYSFAANPLSIPHVIGHRGAAGRAPENTLASLRKASELGIKWVEFDVKLTSDGHAILMHDEILARTTDGSGLVEKTTLEEIKLLDAGSSFSRHFSGEKVPTLEEALDLMVELNLHANVEIKPCPGRAAETSDVTLQIIKSKWPKHLPPLLISSFDAEALHTAKNIAPEIPRGYLFDSVPNGWQRILADLECSTLHCYHRLLSPWTVTAANEIGVSVLAYTVNSARTARALLSNGVAAVFSDYPDHILPPPPSRS